MVVHYAACALNDRILVGDKDSTLHQLRQHEVDVADHLQEDDVHHCGQLAHIVDFELVIVVHNSPFIFMFVKRSSFRFQYEVVCKSEREPELLSVARLVDQSYTSCLLTLMLEQVSKLHTLLGRYNFLDRLLNPCLFD